MSRISRKQLDCLFVFSPGGENADNYFFYHLGSNFIISFLRLAGYTAEQFICNEFINLGKCVRKILMFKARIIGFTVYNTNFITSILIAEQIKKISPETLIVFGGPTATNYSEFILDKYRFIDICFRNEGEETLLKFIGQSYDHKFDLRRIDLGQLKGISYRGGDKIYNNPECNILVENSKIPDYLDRYPSPYLSGGIPGQAAFKIGIITARGCNQNCVYCNCAVLSKRRFFTHSVDRIISEIDLISGYSSGNQTLNIFDDAFSLIPQRAKEICRAIIDNRIRIHLSCTTRCDCVDEELLDMMKEAGFVSVGFSLESANPKTLRIIGKVHKAEDDPKDNMEKEIMFIEKLGTVISYAKKIGIRSVFSSIMSGLPYETIEEANRTVETIDRHNDIDFYSHNFLNIYQGTPLFSTYPKYGYKIESIDNNPIFGKTIFPTDIVKKVKISSKSQVHEAQKTNSKITLKILSLVPGTSGGEGFVNNIILLADNFDWQFVSWLKKILAINGIVIQIYTDKEALLSHSKENYEKLIRYSSPSLKIHNYYQKGDKGLLYLIPYDSSVLNLVDREDDISICDFDFMRSNLENPDVDFLKVLCKESDTDDAASAWDYYCEARKEKNLFEHLVNKRAFPYFATSCKWARSLSNCQKRETLIVDSNSEIRLCWYGRIIGKVGQTYKEIFRTFESIKSKKCYQKKCNCCQAEDHCIKCVSPFPVPEDDYCIKQNMNDITKVVELFYCFDLFKQYM